MILSEAEVENNQMQAKILIVDDNRANVLLLERMLKISGYRNIISTTDSREVMGLYKTFKPDLVLLDLKMPYYTGFEVLEQLNNFKNGDYLPVIVITAQSDNKDRLKALEMGAKDFIVKPFDNAEVLIRIKNMLEIRMLHNKSWEKNHDLEEKVLERTKELQDLQLELLQRLLKAAEFRDNDTGYHINRIGLYSYELGKAAGFSDKYCKLLEHASMMHDIGKVGIPDEILLKPAKLNSQEWEKMKTHTVNGAQILSGSSYEVIKLAEEIALNHHEKWDGSGYPNALKGEEIPISGRIIAICDVFDALLSKRPYKEAWELEAVIEEIKKGSGTHFDPWLVEIFLNNIEKFLDIKEQFKEENHN